MLDESKRTRQKKAEIKEAEGKKEGRQRGSQKTRKGRNRAANQMAKEIQGMMKTGQRKRRKMVVIKSVKTGQQTKRGRKGIKQGERRPKNQGKRGEKGGKNQGTKGLSKVKKRGGKPRLKWGSEEERVEARQTRQWEEA